MKYFISLLFLALSLQVSASKVLIQGSIEGFDGEEIRLGHYQDYITFKKVFIGSTTIENGKFQLESELEQTAQLILMVEDKETSFFAESGQVYNLHLSYSIENNAKRAFEKFLELKFSFPKADELNQRIKQFNNDYQDFFAQNYQDFVVNQANEKIEDFIKEQSGKEVYQQPSFLKNYVEYALANLKDINKVPTNKLEDQYLKERAVLLNHKEYMNFFRQLYREDFEQLLLTKNAKELMEAMMFDEDLTKSIKLLKALKDFNGDELTELYLINGLFEVYHKKTVNQKSNLKLLTQLSKNASTAELKALARSVHNQLSLLSEDRMAPAFTLKDSQGEQKSLDDFKGKPIYLGFWANWSVISLKQLRLIQQLEEKYGDDIHFISINVDEDEAKSIQTKERYQYPWTFLYGGKDYLLREQYEVKTVPVYYLIDSEGKILQRYAPSPENIERKLSSLVGQS